MLSLDRLCPNTGRRPIEGEVEEEEEEEERKKKENFMLCYLAMQIVIEYVFHLQKYLMRVWEEQTFKI